MAGEFDLIRRHAPPGASRADVLLGSGDDAALLEVPLGKALVATVDTLVAGRHFPLETSAYDVGWKSLAVNLSDLAAMGAEAAWVTVALTLPADSAEQRDGWMRDFAAGIHELAEASNVAVVGGDLTAGPLSITVQALGFVKPQATLRRDRARPGDVIAVTGTLGDAALALRQLQSDELPTEYLLQRLNRPTPRLDAGLTLAGKAQSAMDLSDGLIGDLAHILRASEVGACIEVDKLPLSDDFLTHCPQALKYELALSGGDDYELCVCLEPAAFEALRKDLGLPFTAVGRITESAGLSLVNDAGQPIAVPGSGYDHFSDSDT